MENADSDRRDYFGFARPETVSLRVSNSSLNLRMVFMNTGYLLSGPFTDWKRLK